MALLSHRLVLLTEDNLKALGVESLGHRIELMVMNSLLQLVCLSYFSFGHFTDVLANYKLVSQWCPIRLK